MFSTTTNLIDNYASIVEKTNNELGLWVSLGNWMTTMLSIIVALIAIMVGYAIWKNSKEQKDRFRDFLEGQEKLAVKAREEARGQFDKLIIEQQQKMESASTEGKKKIEKIISDLKVEKASIGISSTYNPITAVSVQQDSLYDSINLYGSKIKNIFCIKCGKEFKYRENNSIFDSFNNYLVVPQNKVVHCPYCGADNIPQ